MEADTNNAYGLCPECNNPNTGNKWCSQCNVKRFQQEFPNWTSENKYIDKFIQETQLNSRNKHEFLVWIPYNRLTNIKYLAKGGFSTVYKAIWLDGPIRYWDNEKKQWNRYIYINFDDSDNKIKGREVIIKSLDNSNEEFLNEWKIHLDCLKKINSNFIPIFGFTQDPNNSDYMIVMEFANGGSLRNSSKNISNWYDKLYMLKRIIFGLNGLHESNLVHCNLHDGNILNLGTIASRISDLGLCKPIEYFQNKSNNDIYGVIPYMAPEVLRGKPFTPASDIYSFAMIMWELSSGVPPFYDRAHDFHLSLSICTGERPEIIEGTPKCYIDLMKKCWDLDPLQRPTTSDIKFIIENWDKKALDHNYDDDVVRKRLENIENEQLRKDIEEFWKSDKALKEKQNNNSDSKPITKSHPKAYHASRLLDFNKKLNDILEQKEKGIYVHKEDTLMLLTLQKEDINEALKETEN